MVPVRSLPLMINLKRVTTTTLQQLAKGLDLPITTSAEVLRQMIDGKLIEMDHGLPNVQVVTLTPEVGGEPRLLLQDEGGIFLTVDSALRH